MTTLKMVPYADTVDSLHSDTSSWALWLTYLHSK